jgi:hypothetical protein
MKDYLNQIRQRLSRSLLNEYQSLKAVCPQLLRQLQVTLGSYGEQIKTMIKHSWSGYRHQDASLKKMPTMHKVWKLHILDPRVTPRKQTFLEKLKEIIK